MYKLINLLLLSLFLSACGGSRISKDNESSLKSASDINVELAVGYFKRKQFDVAQEKLEKAIEQNDENLEAYKVMALVMSKLAQDEKADEFYQQALDIKDNDPGLLNSYGAFLCKLDQVDEALKYFERAYNNPFYETPYLAISNAGSCALKIDDLVKAESLLRKALRKRPKLTGALLSMADLGVKSKKYLMARAYIQRYHDVHKPVAESLWIQIQAEKFLGARDHYIKYAKQLLKDFPDSAEAGWVEDQVRDDPNKNF